MKAEEIMTKPCIVVPPDLGVEKQGKTSFQAYCEAHSDADECRIYED
jgi:hypothetical protein